MHINEKRKIIIQKIDNMPAGDLLNLKDVFAKKITLNYGY